METLLSQAEQLPSLLAASRSALVRGWDTATLQRALDWGHFFQQLHSRLLCQPGLRTALERRLCRGRRLSLGHLRRCPQLLGLALLENRALSSAAYQHLLRGLLFPGGHGEGSFIPLLTRRKAASQLLCVHLAPPPEVSAEHWVTPQLRAQAQLLLSQLREEGGGEDRVPSSLVLLDQLPRGLMLYRVVAVALLEPAGEAKARALLLLWLLQGDPAHLSVFCRLLPAPGMASLCSRYPELCVHYFSYLAAWGSRLSYDLLQGEWKVSGLEEDEVPWQEMRERVVCLLQEPEPLHSSIRTQLSQLKAKDGDFEIRGLSVWTDLLLDMETAALEKMLVPNLL
ncbi:Fanconi anemia group F protein [Eublepharis macularius]|uniref:Fanconi anemia group F protein n=1 Tax=Eublepharis macularius TaxID=481883 RepID=A0AA97KP98_EUBMA|nr:Fanconi anemia group F protein [Eublepharis macularius]